PPCHTHTVAPATMAMPAPVAPRGDRAVRRQRRKHTTQDNRCPGGAVRRLRQVPAATAALGVGHHNHAMPCRVGHVTRAGRAEQQPPWQLSHSKLVL
ncbi:hypothetical protein E2562_018337, partial [Oryza meyeriana var. granulata]